MTRALLLASLMLWTGSAWASPVWSDLWQTPDQRAQALLDKARPAEAAKLFHDPRRKAYAELQAGNYAQAAKDFIAFDDSDGQYNRGNALARAGRLREAIQAYDAALARDPNNRDARHNRDLVASALRKRPPPPPTSGGQDKNAGQGNNGKRDTAGGGKSSPGHGQAGSSSAQGDSDVARQNQSGRGKDGQGDAAKPGEQAQAGPDHGKPDQAGSGQAMQTNPGRAIQAANSSRPGADSTEAAPAKTENGQNLGAAAGPVSELQLAREQWLRRIPDDPGGLLRRKFMIEHMLRQQGTQS